MISRYIIYGSQATFIKKPESNHTHKWKVYVRGVNEDLSFFIKKVVFKLHDSFSEPTRSNNILS